MDPEISANDAKNIPPSEQTQSSPERSGLRVIGEFLRLVFIAALIAIPVRYFVAQPFVVRGASMEPNFHDGQYLVINEFAYFFQPPARGDIVVFRYPRDPEEYFIKRVIGLPGETVLFREGRVVIVNAEYPNGLTLDESYLSDEVRTFGTSEPIKLGGDQYFVLGDNRSESSDSRSWGPLSRGYITGYVMFRAWPPQSFGVIRGATY